MLRGCGEGPRPRSATNSRSASHRETFCRFLSTGDFLSTGAFRALRNVRDLEKLTGDQSGLSAASPRGRCGESRSFTFIFTFIFTFSWQLLRLRFATAASP